MSAPDGAIVVAVDRSPDSHRGLDWAVHEAGSRGVGLHLVHAIAPPISWIPPAADEYRELRRAGRELLDEATALAGAEPGIGPVTSEIVDERVAAAIIGAAGGASMIVIGARGHGAATGLLLGSVSQHVTRHAACPVVVVRAQADPKAERVVVGVDGSPSSDKAVGFAIELAARDGLTLVAIHGWRGHTPTSSDLGSESWAKAVERIRDGEHLLGDALSSWATKYPDVTITHEAIPVHPATVLADASEHAALVVVGARGRGAFAGLLLGSVSQTLLHHAACPVAVIR